VFQELNGAESPANCARKIAGPLTVATIFASSHLLDVSTIAVAGIAKPCRTVARLPQDVNDVPIESHDQFAPIVPTDGV
jgi:hypothetical protein